MRTPDTPARVTADLAFIRPQEVHPHPQRPGMLRAEGHARDRGPLPPGHFAVHRCELHDCSASASEPSLLREGFSRLDLSQQVDLQALLQRVRLTGQLEADDATALPKLLHGVRFTMADGARLRILHVAREGLFMRRAGPNGMQLERGDDHDAADMVHADQDIDGTPIRQIMRRLAPRLLRHDSPTHHNHRSPLTVLNIWIPLDQVTRPLALMDKRSLDRARHQVCYGLPTTGILAREGDRRVNDIWTFLHDPGQRWWFSSEMASTQAYVFETLGTPHGACILPGEALAEARYRRLLALVHARTPVPAAPDPSLDAMPDETVPASLRRAIADMDRAIATAATPTDAWLEQAEAALRRVIRKSIEVRVLAWLRPAPA